MQTYTLYLQRIAIYAPPLVHKEVPPVGIEPTHMAPEAIALSTELRGQVMIGQIYSPITAKST